MRTISALWTTLFFCLVCLTAAAEDLSISFTNTISADGRPGGPFILGPTNLVLTNAGATTLTWSLANTSSLLSVSPSSGSLDPGGPATTVTVSLTSAANNLPFGNYSANIWFTNVNDNFGQSVPFSLTVDLVQNGGFETGDFTDWTISDPSQNLVTNTAYVFAPPNFQVYSGGYYALLGEGGSLAYLTQTIPTTPGQVYQISFWLNCDTEPPNEFLFNWNGQTLFDGALTSDDANGTNFTPNVWSNFQFTATATASSTVIEFGARNDSSFFGLDEVSVQPPPPLAFQSITKSGSSLQLTWNSSSGVVYQLQYNTNLAGANWSNIGNSITATTSTVSTSTAITTDPERFYRVQQLP